MIKIKAYGDMHLFFKLEEKDRYMIELTKMKEDIMNAKDLDMLVFCGDLMHTNYNMDNPVMIDIFNFVTDIVQICKKKNIIFRNIKGTSSHDCQIVECLDRIYKNDSPNIRFIYEPEIEELHFNDGDLTIRWMPETYVDETKYKEIIENIFNVYTDVTFFHGSIGSIAENVFKMDIKPTILPKSMILPDDLLIRSNRYFTAGGHVHSPISIDNKIFYINSYTTHNFGDKTEKGHMEFYIYPRESRFEFKRIQNILAPRYITTRINDIEKSDIIEIEKFIKTHILETKLNFNDKLKFRIYGTAGVEASKNIAYIQELCMPYKNIIIEPRLEYVIETKDDDPIDYQDMNITVEDKIYNLYKENYGDVDINVIKDILNTEENKDVL